MSTAFKDAGKPQNPKPKPEKWKAIFGSDDLIPGEAETLREVNDDMRNFANDILEKIDFNKFSENENADYIKALLTTLNAGMSCYMYLSNSSH